MVKPSAHNRLDTGSTPVPTTTCVVCSKAVKHKGAKHCSNACHQEQRYRDYIAKWKSGEIDGSAKSGAVISQYVRRYMLEKANYSCEECGFNDRHPLDGNPIVQIDHVSGDSSDHREENLRVLCPNCHAKTATHNGRNRGKGNPARKCFKYLPRS